MQQMSRAQRMLLIYILWKLREPKIVQKITKLSGGGGITEAMAVAAVEAEATLDLTGDVTVAATKSLSADTINEKTATAGVTVDSLLIKDGVIPDSAYPNALLLDGTQTMTGNLDVNGYGVKFGNVGIKQFDATTLGIYNSVFDAYRSLFLDSLTATSWGDFTQYVKTPQVREKVLNDGVWIDGVTIKDSEPYCDVVNEKTSGSGVTVDSVLLKDGGATFAGDLDLDNNDILNVNSYQFKEDFSFRIKATNDYVELMNKAGTAYKSMILHQLQVRADFLPNLNKAIDLGSAPNYYWRNLELWGQIIFDRLPWDIFDYDHTNNRFQFKINNVVETYIDATGVKTDQLDELTGGAGVNIPTAGDITGIGGKSLLNWNHLELDEITTPTAVADHGKVYTKNDNKLYFQDGAGAEHEIAFV